MITIKSDREIECMRESGKILAEVHNEIGNYLKEGLTTYEIDSFGYNIIKKYKAKASFYKLYDFPGHFCISINDEVIHGIPSKTKYIKNGDLVKIDGGVYYKNFHSDAARTHIVGNVSNDIKQFVERTKNAFFEATKVCKPNNHIQDIGFTISDYIEQFGYSVVDEFIGHGIGLELHEAPEVPNYRTTEKGPKLVKNMTIAVEPMINMGVKDVIIEDDGWTVKTIDHKPSAHYENTILITDDGCEILTI